MAGAAPPREPGSAGISLDTIVRAPTLSGEVKEVPIGDMLKAWQTQPSAERVELLGLLEKAVAHNDADAARQIMAKLAPTTPSAPTPPAGGNGQAGTTGDPRMDQLLKEIAELRTQVSRDGNTVAAVREAGTIQQAATLIAATKEKTPLLAKRADGPTMVSRYVRQVAKNNGHDFDTLPADIKSQALAVAVQDVEANLANFFGGFGLDPATVLAAGAGNGNSNGRGIVAVDDQHHAVPDGKVQAPRWVADTRTGQLVPNVPSTGTLPATPINGAPGGAPGATPPTGNGRLNAEQTIALMKTRRGAL